MKKFLREWCALFAKFVGGFVVVFAWFHFASGLVTSEFLFFQIVAVFAVLLLLVSAAVGAVILLKPYIRKLRLEMKYRSWKKKCGSDQTHSS